MVEKIKNKNIKKVSIFIAIKCLLKLFTKKKKKQIEAYQVHKEIEYY